ncbi:MAG: hypothetical protein WC795_02380 [Candidatus Paceibacterota bacterium]|jgi:ribulose-phosphate 3-epimerase
MAEIIPAIMPKSFEDLENKISAVVSRVSHVHIDLMDGKYVKNISWPYQPKDEYSLAMILAEQEGMPFWEKINFEFDLMVENAHEHIATFIKMGASRLIFHLEAFNDTKEFLEFLEGIDQYDRENLAIGVAILPSTSIEKIGSLIPYIDFVQCMGIEKIGYQGNPFDERVLDHVRHLREKFPGLTISVDGAVNMDTAGLLIDAGADRLVIGSAIFTTPDIHGVIDYFQSL